MKNFSSKAFTAIIILTLLVFSAPAVAKASSLTQYQINAIIGLLQAFGADANSIANVQNILTGNAAIYNGNPAITIISPNGGEQLVQGQTYNITWSSAGVPSNGNIYISLVNDALGKQYGITTTIGNSGSYIWTVPSTINYDSTLGNKFKISATYSPSYTPYTDLSDNYFSIVAPTAQPIPSITVTSPNGGENWQVGQTYNITWTSQGLRPGNNTTVELCDTNRANCVVIARNVDNGATSYNWTIPASIQGVFATPTAMAGQHFILINNNYNNYFSNAPFTITSPATQPSINITSPNGGEILHAGQTYNITWTSQGLGSGNNTQIFLDYPNGSLVQNISYTVSNSATIYSWTIPASITGTFEIGIFNPLAPKTAYSVAPFTIVSGTAPVQPSITVLSPNGGEVFGQTTQNTISYSSNITLSAVHISLTTADSVSGNTPSLGAIWQGTSSNSNSITWDGKTVCQSMVGSIGSNCSTIPTGSYKIYIVGDVYGVYGQTVSDMSNAPFTVSANSVPTQPTISYIYPSSGPVGTPITIYGSGFGINNILYIDNGQTAWPSTDGVTLKDFPIPNFLAQGQHIFRVKNNDGQGNAPISNTAYFTVTSSAIQPSITVVSPNGGETFIQGGQTTIIWQHDPAFVGENINYRVDVDDISGNYYSNISSGSASLVANMPSNGEIGWNIPAGMVPGSYKIRVTENDQAYSRVSTDISNAPFTIVSGTAPVQPSITVLSPNGGERWTQGLTQTINWTTKNIPVSNNVTIELIDSAGVKHYIYNNALGDTVPNNGFFTFIIPLPFPAGSYKAAVESIVNGQSYIDSSDDYFSIVAPSTIACNETDNGLDYYKQGSTVGRNNWDGSIGYYTDYCMGNILTEYWCFNGLVANSNYNCIKGCQNGACVQN